MAGSVALLLWLLSLGAPVSAQTSYRDPLWSTVDGGGAAPATSAPYSLFGTVGQCDATSPVASGVYKLAGGFWPGINVLPPATTTPTLTVTPTPTFSVTPTRTPTTVPSPTPSATPTVTRTSPLLPTSTPTATRAATPSSTPTRSGCPGDCNGNGRVDIDDFTKAANILVGRGPFEDCPAFDANRNLRIDIDDFTVAAQNAVRGCH